MNALPFFIAALAFASAAQAQVTVTDAWVRGTVAGQKTTGAFMQLKSATDTTLVGVRSTVAGTAELHEMKDDGGMMKMRALDSVALPAGKTVDLKPSGTHVMLFDVTEMLKAGSRVPLTLTFRSADGRTSTIDINAEVRPLTSAGR